MASDPHSASPSPTESVAAQTPPVPEELCGYVIDCALSPAGGCFLAIGPAGRGVVLKRMPAECLLRGQLHPSIRERLTRVRELAHAGLANLHGVGREGEEAWLIWEYVEGQTFEAYMAQQHTPRELAAVGRELALTVESLHVQGVIHGALGPTNVLISPYGTVRLTHVSPLLYNDPAADADAVIDLLHAAVDAQGGRKGKWPLLKLLDEAQAENWPLRVLAARLATLVESRQPGQPFHKSALHSRDDDRKSRRRSLWMAAVVVLVGVALAVSAWFAAGQPGRAKIDRWLEPVKDGTG